MEIHDIVLVWLHILPKLREAFPADTVAQHEDMFNRGLPGCHNSRKASTTVLVV